MYPIALCCSIVAEKQQRSSEDHLVSSVLRNLSKELKHQWNLLSKALQYHLRHARGVVTGSQVD